MNQQRDHRELHLAGADLLAQVLGRSVPPSDRQRKLPMIRNSSRLIMPTPLPP